MSVTGKLEAVRYLFQTYVTALPRLAYRSSLSLLLDPKGAQKFYHQVLGAQDLEADDPVLGSIEITDLIPGEAEPQIRGPYHLRRTSDTRILVGVSGPGVFDAGSASARDI